MKKVLSLFEIGFRHLGGYSLLVIFAGILVRLPLLFAPLTYASDSWRQADTASVAYHFYVNGYNLFYPQVFWGGNGPGYVETEFQLYPFLVSILYYFLGEKYWLGKFVSLLFSIFAWVLFYLLAKKVLEETQAAIWSLIFLVFSPLYLRYSMAFMPESTVMLFYIAALFFYVNWSSTSRKSYLVICSVCTAFAILVKPTSIHIGLIFALFAFNKWGGAFLRQWEIWLFALVALVPAVFWYLHARNIYLTYGNTFGLLSGGDSKFGNLNTWLSPHFYFSIIYLETKWILGAAVLPFIAGTVIALKNRKFILIALGVATIGFYYMIVARYSQAEWGLQYHVYMLPFAALAIGLGLKWISDNCKEIVLKSILWLSVLSLFGVTSNVFFGMLFPGNDDLVRCADYVKMLVPPDERIIISTTSFALDSGVENNYQEPDIFFYSKRYGWSLPADWHTVKKMIEFRKGGSNYFVIYDKRLLGENPSLSTYLKNNSVQIGPGIDSGCAIYHFLTPIE